MGRRQPRDIRGPRIQITHREPAKQVIDADFESVDLSSVTHCTLHGQPITRLPAFGPALVQLMLRGCRELASLDGIERCTGLARLDLAHLPALPANELARLAELPELTHLVLTAIDAPPSLARVPSLLALEVHGPATARLDVFGTITTLRRLVLAAEEPWTLGDVAPLAGNVTELVLTNCGAMPASIGALLRLEKLTIRMSRHLRKLPTDVGALASLVELAVDAPIRTIDDSIVACSRLEVLDLDGTAIATLPEDLGRLARLRELRLARTKVKRVPASIGELADLRHLSLPSGATVPDAIEKLALETFRGDDALGARIPRRPPSTPLVDDLRLGAGDPLPADFGDPLTLDLTTTETSLPQLAKLRRLTSAYLTVPDMRAAVIALAGSRRLAHLTLTTDTVPDEIGELSALTSLRVKGGVTELPATIGKLSRLDTLGLWCPHLVRVPDELAELRALRSLWLCVGTELASVFGRLPVTSVTVSCEDGVTSLAALGAMTALTSLDITGPVPALADLLRALATTQIETLRLGSPIRELPDAIGDLARTLTTLDVHRTKIRELPATLRACTALSTVVLPSPPFDKRSVAQLPPIKWVVRSWSGIVRFERAKRQ